MKTNVHQHSIKAYHEEEVKLSKRAEMVLSHLKSCEHPQTDRQVMASLGFSEPNAVRPRITELIKLKLVEERGSVKCPITEKTVRVVGCVCAEVQTEMFQS